MLIDNGIDRPKIWTKLLRGKRVGLLTAASGFDAGLHRSVDRLVTEGIRLTALFGPEHGIRGAAYAGDDVDTTVDSRTGLTVYSLYRKDSKRFAENMVRDVDVIVYDIADVGVRFYTYITTLLYTVEDCARFHKPLVVLDRINPLGGIALEGGSLQLDCHSFMGDYDMPVRYGLTAGEFATMVNTEQHFGCDLTVVEVKGWNRNQLHCDTGLPWIPPSPALQHFENALLYPGTCLLEGVNVSEGRGTADPFALIGAPYIDGERLSEAMNDQHLHGVRFLSASFTPTERKYQGVPCSGIKVLLEKPHSCESVTLCLMLLHTIQMLWPEDFCFLPPGTEFVLPSIDLLSGSHKLREGQNVQEYLAEAQTTCEAFVKRSHPYLIYKGE